MLTGFDREVKSFLDNRIKSWDWENIVFVLELIVVVFLFFVWISIIETGQITWVRWMPLPALRLRASCSWMRQSFPRSPVGYMVRYVERYSSGASTAEIVRWDRFWRVVAAWRHECSGTWRVNRFPPGDVPGGGDRPRAVCEPQCRIYPKKMWKRLRLLFISYWIRYIYKCGTFGGHCFFFVIHWQQSNAAEKTWNRNCCILL